VIKEEEVSQRAFELATRVLGPLVLGGTITPVRPLGARLALAIGDRPIADADLRTRIDVARVRRARLLAAVDTLPDLTGAEWAMVAALNDLVQVTNHELASRLTRGRHVRLLASVRELCEHLPPPRDVRSALGRHATFANVLSVSRTDTLVSWWTGRANFRGQPPTPRLLRWRELRRVRVEPRAVPLSEMCEGLEVVRGEEFADALTMWLSRSPLTDLATATRKAPLFGWSASTLSLVATPLGRTLAWRALARQPVDLVHATVTRAARELPAGFLPAKELADGFAAEVLASMKPKAS